MEDRVRTPKSHFTSAGKPKVPYHSRTEAKQHIRAMIREHSVGTGHLHPYKCPTCTYYHVGGNQNKREEWETLLAS